MFAIGLRLQAVLCSFALTTGGMSVAQAIDPGQVHGVFHAGEETVELTHVYAHLHDNTEGVLDRTPELRIFFADRETSRDVLSGLAFLPVSKLAREGQVRGLLVQMDPNEPEAISVTYLIAPAEPGVSLMNQWFEGGTEALWESFGFDPQRVSGSLTEGEPGAGSGFRFTFDAPVFNEPQVTADLEGKDAADSPQARVLQAQIEAMEAGDLDGLEALSTQVALARTRVRMEAMGVTRDQVAQMLPALAVEQASMLDRIERVVVRGDRATVLYESEDGKQWSNLVLEAGVWKSND